jgi:hypothetical protein
MPQSLSSGVSGVLIPLVNTLSSSPNRKLLTRVVAKDFLANSESEEARPLPAIVIG